MMRASKPRFRHNLVARGWTLRCFSARGNLLVQREMRPVVVVVTDAPQIDKEHTRRPEGMEHPRPARQSRFHAEVGRSSSSLRSRSLTCFAQLSPQRSRSRRAGSPCLPKQGRAYCSFRRATRNHPTALARQEMPLPQLPFVPQRFITGVI